MCIRDSFWGEFWERAQARLLPPPPNRGDMFGLFSLIFRKAHDAAWIETLDEMCIRDRRNC